MRENEFQLRAYVLIDNMQPQYAAFLGTVSRGDVPVSGMSELFLELAPGSEVYGMLDIALKATDARTSFQDVEREFGMIELHAPTVDIVKQAGWAILEKFALSEEDKIKPQVVSAKIINNITPYQAQLINRFRQGSLLVPSESLFIMEVEPAVYITYATNEAEKNADIKLVHFDPVGKYGRLYIAGDESQVKTAMEAAIGAIESISA
ncbi:BMC domain-containing protein [Thermoanaerobacteraceae bacterium SP2]|nr:BMC domain-containing protein [Thermoanaerobacteraceae bacterium SP2]